VYLKPSMDFMLAPNGKFNKPGGFQGCGWSWNLCFSG